MLPCSLANLYKNIYTFNFYFIQTTYENFRYQYDKNANPYNKGILINFRETLCSKIPLSKNDFRSLVLVDESAMVDSMATNIVERSTNQKDKIDIEMGSMRAEDGGIPIPELLRNFDFDKLEDDMKFADLEGRQSFDPFYSLEEDVKDSMQSFDTPSMNFEGIITECGLAESLPSFNSGDEVKESAQREAAADETNATDETDDRNGP